MYIYLKMGWEVLQNKQADQGEQQLLTGASEMKVEYENDKQEIKLFWNMRS